MTPVNTMNDKTSARSTASTLEPESKRPASGSRGASPTEGGGNGSVRVAIEYCAFANYLPVAMRVAEAIREEFSDAEVETDLIAGRGGVFEVSVNGKLVFSKRATYRLPEEAEIFYHVRSALGRQPSATISVTSSG